MGFLKYHPLGNRAPRDLFTTNAPEKQLWQELVMVRHLNRPRGISSKKAISPWIDQAKTYFLDACKSNWRSAGLLYYYSFLNLAKAYLAAKRVISARTLMSSSIYHGLSANPQSPNRIVDFEIQIHPPNFNARQNIFALLYQKISNQRWPYRNTITIKLSDVLPYCHEIASEIINFYGIDINIIYIQSLIRVANNHVWFELNLPHQAAQVIQSHIDSVQFTVIDSRSLTNTDKEDWLDAYERTMYSFRGTCFLRTPQIAFAPQNRGHFSNRLYQSMLNLFSQYALPIPVAGKHNEAWQFIPNIRLNNVAMKWHPFLSDYLIAFILSEILRYHPDLFSFNSKDSYVAEAWCNQSAITSLRYYLMSLTTPPIRYD